MAKENRNFIDLPFEEIRLTQDINKVIMVHSPRFFEKNFEGIKAALSDYDVLLIGPDWSEIMPKHVNKASALWKICDRLGIKHERGHGFWRCTKRFEDASTSRCWCSYGECDG